MQPCSGGAWVHASAVLLGGTMVKGNADQSGSNTRILADGENCTQLATTLWIRRFQPPNLLVSLVGMH